jgi:UDP-N-acetylmuramate dehydrogenase
MGAVEHIADAIADEFPAIEIRRGEPMSAHTSFRIGGPVTAMVLPKNEGELCAVIARSRAAGVAPVVIGNGTNLLASDGALDLLVVKTHDGLGHMSAADGVVTAGSGVLLSRLAQFALANGLTGLEFAHGIPGTLGGAVCMNAGAYGGEMKDVVAETVALTPGNETVRHAGEANGFAYRHSRFSDSGEIVLSAQIRLKPGDPAAIRARMEELADKRRRSQPLNLPSAGSTFQRPAGHFAAALIEEAGLKGFAVGGAQVSEKHAGFVVNRGGATFQEVRELMAHIQQTVYERFGVTLTPEVKLLT